MSKLETLQDVLVDLLKDTYDAEKQLVEALPKMAKAVKDPALKRAITSHLDETRTHVSRLEGIFADLDLPVRGKKCKAMAGLTKEASEITHEHGKPELVDAVIIAAAQKVEHYEIAAYGTMIAYANVLGLKQVSSVLESTLEEERAADKGLTGIAQGPLLYKQMARGDRMKRK